MVYLIVAVLVFGVIFILYKVFFDKDAESEPEQPHTIFVSDREPTKDTGKSRDLFVQYGKESSPSEDDDIKINKNNYQEELSNLNWIDSERKYVWHTLEQAEIGEK